MLAMVMENVERGFLNRINFIIEASKKGPFNRNDRAHHFSQKQYLYCSNSKKLLCFHKQSN